MGWIGCQVQALLQEQVCERGAEDHGGGREGVDADRHRRWREVVDALPKEDLGGGVQRPGDRGTSEGKPAPMRDARGYGNLGPRQRATMQVEGLGRGRGGQGTQRRPQCRFLADIGHIELTHPGAQQVLGGQKAAPIDDAQTTDTLAQAPLSTTSDFAQEDLSREANQGIWGKRLCHGGTGAALGAASWGRVARLAQKHKTSRSRRQLR